jgi:hypothetical protein
MLLAADVPIAALARMVGEHDTRLWRGVECIRPTHPSGGI